MELQNWEPESFLILVVDDTPTNLQLVMGILEQVGYVTTFATSGKQALERLATLEPDLILLDLMMPEMSGIEVCEILQANPKYSHIPIIFLTASNEREHLVQAFEKGARDFITKPFHSAEMLARVKTHLELKRTQDELKKAYIALEELVVTDSLTGVANRRAIVSFGKAEFERGKRYQSHFSVLMIDLDYFKKINDTYGHATGDKYLKLIAEKLNNTLRKVDFFGRFGGEEFVAILPETSLPEAIEIAERLRFTINNLASHLDNFSCILSISIGVAIFQPTDESLQDILNRADQALYDAKKSGRNRVRSQP
ncbi:MAG: diguanylate cyclase [Snowella sp.]|nr:diguanylate cyclase [Snowella sp.]